MSRRREWMLVGGVAGLFAAGVAAYQVVDSAGSAWRVDNAFVTGRVITIVAPVDGTLDVVGVKRFERYTRGDLAFAINTRRLAAKAESARASLRSALVELGRECLKLPILHERAALSAQARALAEKNLEDARRLAAEGYISSRQYEQRLFEATQAQGSSRVEALELGRHSWPSRSGTSYSVALTEAVAALREALMTRRESEIHLDGGAFVYDVHALLGQWVAAGTPLATLLPVSDVRVQANVLETQIPRVAVGQAVQVTLDRGLKLGGVVEVIVPSTAAALSRIQRNAGDLSWTRVPQRVPVVIRLAAKEAALSLVAGESARVEFLGRAAPPEAVASDIPGATGAAQEDLESEVRAVLAEAQRQVAQEYHLPGACLVSLGAYDRRR